MILNARYTCVFGSAVGHSEVSGAHNGVALITEQQEPQQYEEQDTIVPVDLRHLPNEECPNQCLTKGILSLTSSLEVPEGVLHPAVELPLVILVRLRVHTMALR